MRSEGIIYGYTYESPLPVSRLVVQLADKAQVCTQRSWKRPYGVGLLVAGLDESGAHLYYNCPSGNYLEYQAFAIGSRSQAAKTYLERKFDNFTNSSHDDLVKDALFAIRETLQGEKLTNTICTVAVVGIGEPFHVLDQENVKKLIDAFEVTGEEGLAGGAENKVVVKVVVPKQNKRRLQWILEECSALYHGVGLYMWFHLLDIDGANLWEIVASIKLS